MVAAVIGGGNILRSLGSRHVVFEEMGRDSLCGLDDSHRTMFGCWLHLTWPENGVSLGFG